VSRRFFFYSLYGMLLASLFLDIIPVAWALPIEDRLLSAMTAGAESRYAPEASLTIAQLVRRVAATAAASASGSVSVRGV